MSVKIIGTTSGVEQDVEAASRAAFVSERNPDGTLKSAPLTVVLAPAANTGGTLTLPAVAGQFHYITSIHIARNSTALLAGTATLTITTTNLAGPRQYRVGNAMAAGGTQTDVALQFCPPLKSNVANVATTLVFPAAGAAVLWTVIVDYFTGP